MAEDIRVMTVLYLIYGASFLLIALGVGLSTRKAAPLRIVGAFTFLALFGLVHGCKEFCDLALYLRRGSSGYNPLEAFSEALMLVSFVLLLEFALKVLVIRRSRQWTAVLPWMFATVLLFGLVVAGGWGLPSLDHLGRWVLGAPSAVLTAWALFVLGNRLRPLGSRLMVAGALGASLAFALYAFFVAWVSPTLAGFPVQLYRTTCALLCAGSVLILLRGFWVLPPHQEET